MENRCYGTRQEARGKSEEGVGDFTFRYILLFEKPLRVYGFFPFTYLTRLLIVFGDSIC